MRQAVIDKSTSPYINESMYLFLLDSVILLVFACFFLIIPTTIPMARRVGFVSAVAVLHYLVQFVANYHLGVLAFLDRRKGIYACENLLIRSVTVESSWSGWLWSSLVSTFWPRELAVERYKLLTVDEFGNKKNLRCVMSRAKLIELKNFIGFCSYTERLKVSYLRRTRIALRFDLADEALCRVSKRDELKLTAIAHRINSVL